jgi:hypothetical protein
MIVDITVNNWEKYQGGRKGQKTYTWFKVYNDIFDDVKFLELTVKQRMFFIFLLSLCSKKNSKTIEFNPKYDQKRLKMTQKQLTFEINVLKNQGFITVSRHAHVALEQNRIEQNRIYIDSPRPIKPKLLEEPKVLSSRNDVKEIVDLWNINCGHFSLEDYNKLPMTSIQKIHGLLDNDGLDFWKDLIKKASQYKGGDIDLLFLINSPELRYKIQKTEKPVDILEGCYSVKDV